MSVPTLETPRLLLTPPSSDDTHDLIQLKTDPQIRSYLGGPLSVENAKAAVQKELNAKQHWTAREKTTGVFLGILSLTPHHNGSDTELSYQFQREHWGSGYAKEAAEELIR